MTVEHDWKFTELWNKYDHSKCLNVITARRFFEAGIKAGQEIEWHDEKVEPMFAGDYLTYGKNGIAISLFDGERWDSIFVKQWANIPTYIKPPKQENNASTGI